MMKTGQTSTVPANSQANAIDLDSEGRSQSAWKLLNKGNKADDLFWSLGFRLGKKDQLLKLKPEGDYQRSVHLWLNGRKSQAVSILTRLASKRTSDVLPALQLAMFLRSQNLISAAKSRFQKIYSEFGDFKPVCFYLAETCLIDGEGEKALKLLQCCPDEVVEHSDFYWRLARCYETCADHDKALECYQEAEKHTVESPRFWMDYAKLAFSSRGQEQFQDILERGDSVSGQTLFYASSAAELCKTLDADGLWERFLLLQLERGGAEDRILPELIYACSKLFAKGKSPEKMEQAKAFASKLPLNETANPEAFYAMANVLFFYNQIQQGLRMMEEGHRIDPEAWRRQGGYLFHSLYDQDLSPEEVFARNKFAGSSIEKRHSAMPSEPVRELGDRPLRIGWVSPDLRTHPVGYFLDAVVDHFPQGRIESFYYDNFDARDILAERFRSRPGWRNIKGIPDEDVAKMVRADQVDILVDLSGHTTGNRLIVFALKPAPVQISWLGYPSTTGLERIDFRISDHVVEPPGKSDELSTESIWRMPNGFHAFCPPFDYSDVTALPAVKEGIITFGCFNNLHKVNERVLQIWAEILKAVPNSRLLLKHENLSIAENRVWIAQAMQNMGVEHKRVHFKGRMDSVQKHIAAYSWVDIALDPFPYNGTTTNCDALYMGVPVIGLEGDRHASRVTASFMRRLGLEDWVAASEADYVRIAKEKASDLQSLAELRAGLRQRFIDSPLGNPKAFAKDLADAFWGMWEEAKNSRCDGPQRTTSED